MSDVRPITLLIAALGGEGGGVLTQWIVAAAERSGFPVQSTSIPGVAQRTGATTYYIEILPVAHPARRPVFALAPGGGDVDVVLASELLEAGRTIANGFVTPDRTTLIASTSRTHIVTEKMAMGDGRFDLAQLRKAAESHAKHLVMLDLEAVAKQNGVMINAVMLGVLSSSAVLPIAPDIFETIIRDENKAVEANLRGFRAGQSAAHDSVPVIAGSEKRPRGSAAGDLALDAVQSLPQPAQEFAREGVRRLTAYQDEAYARLYLDRLRVISDIDRSSGANGKLAQEVARQLAVRMSYEDVIRVAEAKIDPARLARLEAKAGDGPYTISEFLKPGIEEMCSVLPARLGRRILALAERRGWMEKHWAMQVHTTSLSGYARFWFLAKLRRWRRGTLRYAEEQQQIEGWLALIADAAKASPQVAIEIAECARLIKGYGDTLKRGLGNYRLIADAARELLAAGDGPRAADAIASARVAALRDPEGEALARCLSEIRHPLAAAAE